MRDEEDLGAALRAGKASWTSSRRIGARSPPALKTSSARRAGPPQRPTFAKLHRLSHGTLASIAGYTARYSGITTLESSGRHLGALFCFKLLRDSLTSCSLHLTAPCSDRCMLAEWLIFDRTVSPPCLQRSNRIRRLPRARSLSRHRRAGSSWGSRHARIIGVGGHGRCTAIWGGSA